MSDELNEIRAFLGSEAGPIGDTGGLIGRLTGVWSLLEGSGDGGMPAAALDRLEAPVWDAPVLHFTVERGAGLEYWHVNLDERTATPGGSGYRQLTVPPKLDVGAITLDLMVLVEGGADDPRLLWLPGHAAVRPVPGAIVPDAGPMKLVIGRRHRLHAAWKLTMTSRGWREDENGWWSPDPGGYAENAVDAPVVNLGAL